MFNSPSLPDASLPRTNYTQPNLGHGLRIWWTYYWPTFLISSVITGIVMILLRKAWENLMISGYVVIWSSRALPYVVVLAVSLLSIHRILGKKFRSFYIALLPRHAPYGAEPLPRSFQRTVRVWWVFSWRSVVYSVVIRVAGSIGLSLTIGILTAIGGMMGAAVPFISQVVIDGAVGVFVIYSGVLDEEFRDFRVPLVPRAPIVSAGSATEPAQPNPIPQ